MSSSTVIPRPLPTAAFTSVSAKPPWAPLAHARTMPAPMRCSTASKVAQTLDASASSKETQMRLSPASFSSGEVMRSILPIAVAKDTSVGGTSKSSKEPDMESLPPMAPTPKSI